MGATLLLVILAIHGWALDGGWRIDDAGQLINAATIAWWRLLFDPTAWRTFNGFFFTPGLALAYKVDQWLFGINAAAHYAHVLLSLWLLVWLSFTLLRRVLGIWWAFFACFLFLLSAPVAAVVQLLPARHYVEGFVFALLAVHCHLRGVASNRFRWFVVGAFNYLLASLFKEVFATLLLPLVILSLVFPINSTGHRGKRVAVAGLYLLTALFYVIWRSMMLDSVVGGYSGSLEGFWQLNRVIEHLPWPILGPPGAISISVLILVAGAVAWALFRQPRLAWLIAGCAVAVIAPFAALPQIVGEPFLPSDWIGYRFSLLPAWTLIVGSAWALSQVQGRGRYPAVIVAACLSFLIIDQALNYAPVLHSQTTEYDTQARFIERHSGDAIVITKIMGGGWAASHKLLRTSEVGQVAPVVISKYPQLRSALLAHQTIWAYDPDCRCVVTISEQALQNRQGLYQAMVTKGVPAPLALFLQIKVSKNNLEWEVGPAHGEIDLEHSKGNLNNIAKTGRLAISRSVARELNWLVLYRSDLEGHEVESGRIPFAWRGTLLWHIGVFVDAAMASRFSGTSQSVEGCSMTTSATGDAPVARIDHLKPVRIHGWMNEQLREADAMSRDVAVTLSQNGAIKYLAFLYHTRNGSDAMLSSNMPKKTMLDILDADLTRVIRGEYKVDILWRSANNRLVNCETKRNVLIF